MTRTTNAKLAGFTFLFYIAIGITQMVLSRGMSGSSGTGAMLALIAERALLARVNILLMLLTCVSALTLAIALYGLTRDEDPELAILALSFRASEALLAAIAPIASLGLLWVATNGNRATSLQAADALGGFLIEARNWNTTLSATLFAFGSTVFSWLLVRGRIVPVLLGWLGVIASLLLVLVLPLQLAGFLTGPLTQLVWLPMAAYEIPLGFWLLTQGTSARTTRSGLIWQGRTAQ